MGGISENSGVALDEEIGSRQDPELYRWVEQRLVARRPAKEIAMEGATKYSVTERTVYAYMARVRAGWAEANQDNIEQRRERFLGQLAVDRELALEAGDFKAVAALAKTQAQVEGVLAPREIRVADGRRPPEAMSPEERRREIEELRARKEGA